MEASRIAPPPADSPAAGDCPARLELVADDSRLAQVCALLRRSPVLAMDTEFVRTRTFYPNLGLIQLAGEDMAYLVDPLAVQDLAPLKELLADPGQTKVFHSCSEDLETLYRVCGFVPAPVFDTQVAAAFLGFGLQLSLQSLAEQLAGESLGKDETRSNWLKRPLSPAQMAYAAEDVLCLPRLYRRLVEELRHQDRLAWVLEECASLVDPGRFLCDPSAAHLRLGGLWNYRPRDLAALRELCALREREAQARDLPRGFILTDQVIHALVRKAPHTLRDLQAVEGLAAGEIRRNGRVILQLFQDVRALADADLPARVPRPPHTKSLNEACAELRQVVEVRARELHVPPELLATKKTLTEVLRCAVAGKARELPAPLRGWRAEVIGQTLSELAETLARRMAGMRR